MAPTVLQSLFQAGMIKPAPRADAAQANQKRRIVQREATQRRQQLIWEAMHNKTEPPVFKRGRPKKYTTAE